MIVYEKRSRLKMIFIVQLNFTNAFYMDRVKIINAETISVRRNCLPLGPLALRYDSWGGGYETF